MRMKRKSQDSDNLEEEKCKASSAKKGKANEQLTDETKLNLGTEKLDEEGAFAKFVEDLDAFATGKEAAKESELTDFAAGASSLAFSNTTAACSNQLVTQNEQVVKDSGRTSKSSDFTIAASAANCTLNYRAVSSSTASDSEPNSVDKSLTKTATAVTVSTPSLDELKQIFNRVHEIFPKAELNIAETCKLLEQESNQNDRVRLVMEKLLQQLSSPDKLNIPIDVIFQDVEYITKSFPNCNPEEVYNLLEGMRSDEDRRDKVIKIIQDKVSSGLSLKKEDSFIKSNPIYRDMLVISKMFPDKDKNEIYAYVEAHHDKPNRIEIVIEELLATGNHSQNTVEDCCHNVQGASTDMNSLILEEELLQEEVNYLREIFPDCDPNYLHEALEERKADPNRTSKLATEMFEKKNYPKGDEVISRLQQDATKRKLRNLDFTFEDILKKFPKPVEVFHSEERPVGKMYQDHCMVKLKNDFPLLKSGYVKQTFAKHHYHLTPTVKELQAFLQQLNARNGSSKKLHNQQPRKKHLEYPDEPDEFFFHEVWYLQHENDIKDYITKKEHIRLKKVELARHTKELYECECCCCEDILFEEMFACYDGHLYCRSTEVAMANSIFRFSCLASGCEHEFPLTVIQSVLLPKTFSVLLRKLQEQEIQQANIPDLVSCPFCSFSTIMSDPNDKVFKCLNPDCLKESCRLCHEPNHVPLRCNEIEKQSEVSMRTFIENRVTESMLRTCSNCKKRFFKDFGCNKMTCVCGTTMCYVCRKSNIDYNHFTDGRCSDDNAQELHKKEMAEALKEAEAEYIRSHPEVAGVSLKYDPKKLVQNLEKMKRKPRKRRHENDEAYQLHEENDEDDEAFEEDDDYSDDDEDYQDEEDFDDNYYWG